MGTSSLSRVSSFNVFAPDHGVWIHFSRREWCNGPHFWSCEATKQNGQTLHKRLVSSEHMETIWQRYAAIAQPTYFS